MLLPTRCPICDAPGAAPCGRCQRGLRPAPSAGPIPEGLDACHSLLLYEGAARPLVTRLKYRNDRAALTWLAERLAHLVKPPAGTIVTWPPTSRRRRGQRGFDQAELLARAVARRWGLPCRRLLVRRSGTAQTGASAVERHDGPVLAATRAVRGPVVVVDDVVTTGSTLRAAARAVRGAGAAPVVGLTAAWTPRRAAPAAAATEPPRSVSQMSRNVGQSLKSGARSAE